MVTPQNFPLVPRDVLEILFQKHEWAGGGGAGRLGFETDLHVTKRKANTKKEHLCVSSSFPSRRLRPYFFAALKSF